MTVFLRNWLEGIFTKYLLKSSFNLNTALIVGNSRVVLFWVVVVGVLGLLKGSILPLWYGCKGLFCLLAAVPFVPGRGMPGTLFVAALDDLVNWTGCFRARCFPRLRPAFLGHALFALGGVLAACVVLADIRAMFFYMLTGLPGRPLFSDRVMPWRFVCVLVIMFHLAVTSYCLNWCQRGQGLQVYAFLHLLGMLVGGHLLWLFQEPSSMDPWQFFLEGGLLGSLTMVAAKLYWRGWQVRKPAPAELALFLEEGPPPGGGSRAS